MLDSLPGSMIQVNVALANRSHDYWILDTGATNHVTGNRHIIETLHSMAKEENHVNTAINSFVDGTECGSITLYVDSPNAKPTKIVL
jgi:hypothetical protein